MTSRSFFLPLGHLLLLVTLSTTTYQRTWGQAADGIRKYPPDMPGAESVVYKTTGDVKLSLYMFKPEGHQATDKRPAMVCFFGGGWTSGSPQQFENQCRYLASRGIVAITADYRVASRHKVPAVECVRDAKSAIRWVRQHAAELGVDPDRIAAAGGSAGGHIAACTATIKEFDEPKEDASISSAPNALVLFNPAMALADFPTAPEVDAKKVESMPKRLGVEPKSLSPAHHVSKGLVPTIIYFGTEDQLLKGAEYFKQQAVANGDRCEVVTYEGQKHGFFNYGRGSLESFKDTLKRTDQFFVSLGWLQGAPSVDAYFRK